MIEQSTPEDSTDSWARLKTGSAARRTVPLADETVQMLAAHLAAQSAEREQPVFRTPTGLMWHSGMISAAMRALTERTLTFHGLRHFYASALIREGLRVKTVATLLGHASAETTLATFVHLFDDEDERTRDAIGAALHSPVGPVRDGGRHGPVSGEGASSSSSG